MNGLYHDAETIVFASVGVRDVVENLYQFPQSLPAEPRILNVFARNDSTPGLDCQYGIECLFNGSRAGVHEELVYGNEGYAFLRQQQPNWPHHASECTNAPAWNHAYAVCAAQQKVLPPSWDWYLIGVLLVVSTLLFAQSCRRPKTKHD